MLCFSILAIPVLAEVGSVSVLADPNDFTIKYYLQQDITNQITESKAGTPLVAGYPELMQISPVTIDGKIFFSIADIQALPSILVTSTPVLARFEDKTGKWYGMEYTAPTGDYIYSLDTQGVISALINTVKNQQQRIDNLEARVTELEKKAGI